MSNIISYWKFDEASGNAADSVGSNTLTNNNSAGFVTGLLNNCADLGTTLAGKAFYKNSDLGVGGTAYSISMWVKLRTEITTDVYRFTNQCDAGTHTEFIIDYRYNSGTRQLSFDRSRILQGDDAVLYNITLGTTNWYHLVLTYDLTNVKGYVNGVLVGTTAASGNGINNGESDKFVIGMAKNLTDNSSPMYVDETSVYNTALSQYEVTLLYNGGTPLPYPFIARLTQGMETVTTTDTLLASRRLVTVISETVTMLDSMIVNPKWTKRSKSGNTSWTDRSKSQN